MRSLVEAPTSAMNSGTRGIVSAIIAAEIQSFHSTATITTTGTITARNSCGRYSEK